MLIKFLLTALLAAALVLAVIRATALRRHASGGPAAHVGASRIDGLAIWVAVLVPSSVVLLWHNASLGVLAAPLGVVLLWFLYRAAAPGPAPLAMVGEQPANDIESGAPGRRSAGRGAAIYHLILTAVALWATSSLTAELGSDPTVPLLGTLIQHVIIWIVLLLATVGWLLSAFATPGEPPERPSRVQGVFEACLTGALVICFLSVS